MSKSVIWSSAVFTMFMGSAAYVGISTAMTHPAQAMPEVNARPIPVVAKAKPKAVNAVHRVAPAVSPVSLLEQRT